MGYYDFPKDLAKLIMDGAGIEDLFYIRDLEQRKLFINEEINPVTVEDHVRHIMQINKEDKDIPVEQRKPILLYITSDGGCVDSGYKLIDVIEASKTPVYTINCGWQYSMGFLIGIAGHKRFAFKNAKYLMHDGSSFVYNSSMKAQDQMVFQRKLDARVKEHVLRHTNITSEVYDEKMRTEWYMFAEEAKELGVTDYIVGVDCELEEVI